MLVTLKHARCLLTLGAVLIACSSQGQSRGDSLNEERSFFTPTLGAGIGMLTYYGEVSENYKTNNPIMNRLAYQFTVNQPLANFLDLEFFFWRGTIAANERSVDRNLNFESTLTGGGLRFLYNFDHLLKPDRTAEPFVGVGFEYFEFNTKTDLFDEFGNRYHYWADGSIRNLPENSPNSELAVRIQRDYRYETDVRELYRDELGLYDEFAFGIPISAGARLLIGQRWKFRVEATYHLTFTDFVDGVTPASAGNRQGNSANDNFLYTGIHMSYDLTRDRSREKFVDVGPFEFDDQADTDGDGVIDWIDKCARTPSGVEVDDFGCPLDGDNDNVANFKDDELNSAPKAVVDSVGVTYTDARLLALYEAYMDTTGKFSPIENESYTITIVGARTKRKRDVNRTIYAVKVGEYEEAIPSEMVNSILNFPDVQTLRNNDQIVVAVGSYNTIAEAMDRKAELNQSGMSSTGVIAIYPDGRIRTVDGKIAKFSEQDQIDNNQTLYRVQLGAFTRKANEKVFEGFDNVIAVSSDDGFTRYYSGSFSSYEDAARHKVEATQRGFKNAYVVALRGGRKVPLKDAGATVSPGYQAPKKLTPEERQNLKFRVQLGTFKKQVPTEELERYMELDDVDQKRESDGTVKYVAGSFSTYEEANAYKKRLIEKGFEGVFVVGEYQGQILPAEKALEMTR